MLPVWSEYFSNLTGLGSMLPREGCHVIKLTSGIFPTKAIATHIEKASAVLLSSQIFFTDNRCVSHSTPLVCAWLNSYGLVTGCWGLGIRFGSMPPSSCYNNIICTHPCDHAKVGGLPGMNPLPPVLTRPIALATALFFIKIIPHGPGARRSSCGVSLVIAV